MNQKLCPVCNTVNTNTDKCVNCGNMFALPNTPPVITSNVLDNMPIASTIPVSTINNIAPPLSSLADQNNMTGSVQVNNIEPASQVMPMPSQPVMPVKAPVNISPTPVSAVSSQTQTNQNISNQVLPQMQVLLGQEPTLAKSEVKQDSKLKFDSNFNLFAYIFKAFIKPFDEYKNNEEDLARSKNNLLIALIMILSFTIFGLIGTMLDEVREIGFLSSEVTWVWSNLKNVNYLKYIFTTMLSYGVVLYAISGVYYLAGLVLKKEINFMKLSSAVLTAFIPITFMSVVVHTTSWFLPTLLTLLIGVISTIYSVLIFIELINDQTKIEKKNNRIYFNLSCISILFVLLLLGIKVLASI